MEHGSTRYAVVFMLVLFLSINGSVAVAEEYKCYVTGSDSLHYIVIVDYSSVGMAAIAARHIRIETEKMGKVDVQNVIECREIDTEFRDSEARKLDKETPRESIKNPRN